MIQVNRKIATTVAVLAGLTGATLAAAPAVAAPTGCPSGATCLWKDSNYLTNGSVWQNQYYQYSIPNFANYNYNGTNINLNDSVSSVYNNGNYETAYLYNYSPRSAVAFVQQIKTGTALVSSQWNDQLSSGWFQSTVPHPN